MTKQKIILVVEDDAEMNNILRDFLKKHDYAAITVTSASAAWKLLATQGHSIDLVLSDIKLGSMSGLELLKRIIATHPNLPVVLFSVFDDLEAAALKSGARRFLKKPFSLEKLAQVLGQELGGTTAAVLSRIP